MRTVSRLRLLFFLLFTSLLMCCPLCYLLPCRNYAPPSEAHPLEPIKWFLSSNTYASGGGGENRTPVQNTFLFASYSNSYYILQSSFCCSGKYKYLIFEFLNVFSASSIVSTSGSPAKLKLVLNKIGTPVCL